MEEVEDKKFAYDSYSTNSFSAYEKERRYNRPTATQKNPHTHGYGWFDEERDEEKRREKEIGDGSSWSKRERKNDNQKARKIEEAANTCIINA